MRVFRVIAIEEAFSVPGVTPPLSRDVIPLMESFSVFFVFLRFLW